MVAVEQPRSDCGHAAALTQQCGRCLRWCCPECYAPWTALACGDCRAEARAASAGPPAALPAFDVPTIEVAVELKDPRCRDRSRARTTGSRRRREREGGDVHTLAARVADLERRLAELRPGG